MLDTGYSMLDTGYSMLDTGYSMLDTRCLILDARTSDSRYSESSIQRPERGVSLVEVLIVLSLVGVLILAIAPHMRSGRQVWEIVGDRHADVLQNARIGMRKMTRELRQSLSISAAGGDHIEFVDRSGNDMRFQYSAQYLEYGPPGSLSALAGPVDSLSFTYYMEDGVTTTTAPDEIRSALIQLITSDSEGKAPPITLSSLVYIRKGPDIVYSLLDLAIFGSAGLVVQKDSTVMDISSIGSDDVVELGKDTTVKGDVVVRSVDNLDMDSSTTLNGTVTTASDITLPDGSVFSAGGEDQTIGKNQTLELEPGSYGDLDLGSNVRLTLDAGDYYFNSILTSKNFVLNVPGDGNVRIFVVGAVDMGKDVRIAIDDTIISVSSETAREKAREVYIETLGTWGIGNGGEWLGAIFAPNGDIETGANGYITGALYSGQNIIIDDGGTVYFVPANDDILPPQFLS